MRAKGTIPAHWFRLYTWKTSVRWRSWTRKAGVPDLWRAGAAHILRAGLASFVAALMCIPCRSMYRARTPSR